MEVENPARVAAAITSRHAELGAALRHMAPVDLMAPSLLPGWSRLAVVCHLRYGAEACHAMTLDVVAGRETAFYPDGRSEQRPATLAPRAGEKPSDVVQSFITTSERLDRLWATLGPDRWNLVVQEPDDNRDLGTVTLGLLALLRLTEVEVHGSDLDVAARPWSTVFVETALPLRVRWLPTRRSNHRPVDHDVHGTWVLRPTDGSPFTISSTPEGVTTTVDTDIVGEAEIAGTNRELLAFLLGRLDVSQLSVSGDRDLVEAFHRAFPAP